MSENSPPQISGTLERAPIEGGLKVKSELRPSRHQRSPADVRFSTPRLLRLRDAPRYLGMNKNRFKQDVRPWVTVIPIGRQGVAFDRLDLDAWADEHKRRNGRPAVNLERRTPWDVLNRSASPNAVGSGISTSGLEEREFARALEQVISPKRRNTSRSG